jgi:SSS family solute:Na+ symporter
MPIPQPHDGGLTLFDHAVIIVYLLAMLTMGVAIARKQKSTDDFFVAGRNMPAWAVGISIFASLLSTITYLGMPGEMFRTGISFLTRQLSVPFVLLVVWLLWIPFFMRLNLTSVYEYLERRFNYATRALAAVLCLMVVFGWISVVVLTASRAMAEITNLDLAWFFGTNGRFPDADMHAIILSIGTFSILYTTLGGIRAVVWTDVVQFFILMLGALLTMASVAWMTDSGIGDWIRVSQEYRHEEVEWFSWDPGNRSTVMFISTGMFFWYICTHGANQVALQRYFTLAGIREARRSYLINAIVGFLISLVLAGVGISLMYFLQHAELPASAALDSADIKLRNDAQDNVFPQFIRIFLPSGLRGLVVAALFAAAMSTIDSGANSVSTVLTVDFFRRFAPQESAGKQELRRARTLTAAIGIIVVATTVVLYHVSKGYDIITLCQRGFNCFLGPLGALFVLAMFSSRATARSVIPAVLVGEFVGVGTSYSKELFGFDYSTHLVIPGSWLATIVTAHLFAILLGTRADEQARRWMWKPIVRGNVEHIEN